RLVRQPGGGGGKEAFDTHGGIFRWRLGGQAALAPVFLAAKLAIASIESRLAGTISASATWIAKRSSTKATSSRTPVESTMPVSIRESASAGRASVSPNRKLSAMKARISALGSLIEGSFQGHAASARRLRALAPKRRA